MMENMGYDLTSSPGLNFGKGRRMLLRSFIPKGKAPDYYHRTCRGLGYVSTPISSTSESEESLYHYRSSGTSSWESDVNVGNIFKELSVNMVSTSHPKNGDKEMTSRTQILGSTPKRSLGYSLRATWTTNRG